MLGFRLRHEEIIWRGKRKIMDYARGYGEIEVLSDIGSGLNEGGGTF